MSVKKILEAISFMNIDALILIKLATLTQKYIRLHHDLTGLFQEHNII